ncbi:hypothetical protein MAPG_00963, partial [Magnaporthiopsis poae ATCC 64411]
LEGIRGGGGDEATTSEDLDGQNKAKRVKRASGTDGASGADGDHDDDDDDKDKDKDSGNEKREGSDARGPPDSNDDDVAGSL